jgi:hypothetical protein
MRPGLERHEFDPRLAELLWRRGFARQ